MVVSIASAIVVRLQPADIIGEWKPQRLIPTLILVASLLTACASVDVNPAGELDTWRETLKHIIASITSE